MISLGTANEDKQLEEIRLRKMREMMSMAVESTVPNSVIHINTVAEFEKMMEDYKDNLIVVDFWAQWCAPCRAFGPVFEQVQKEVKNVVFAKLNVETDAGPVAQQLGVTGIPTIMFFHNRRMVHRQVGGPSKPAFQHMVNQVLEKVSS